MKYDLKAKIKYTLAPEARKFFSHFLSKILKISYFDSKKMLGECKIFAWGSFGTTYIRRKRTIFVLDMKLLLFNWVHGRSCP